MRRRAGGNIVNIASDLVEHPVVPYHVLATAKATLIGFSRHLSAEFGAVGHMRKLSHRAGDVSGFRRGSLHDRGRCCMWTVVW